MYENERGIKKEKEDGDGEAKGDGVMGNEWDFQISDVISK